MNSTAKLGALMLAALVAVAIFILNIEKISIGRAGDRFRVRATFPSVAGLEPKTAVRIAGVRVGLAETIALEQGRATVTLALDPGVVLHEGARASLKSIGLLGELYVELDPGPPDAPALPRDALIVGAPPAGFDDVIRQASDIGVDIKGVTSSLRGAIGGPEGERRLDEILENIRDLTASIRDLVAANRGNVDATMANFRDFSETLRVELPKLAEQLNRVASDVEAVVAENRDDLKGSTANIRELSDKLKTTADNLNTITGKIARGEGSVGKLVNDEATVQQLNSTLASVESGVESLKNTIGRAERWKLDVNMRAESLPRVDDTRFTVGGDLYTNDRRFFRAGIADAPQGKRRETREDITTTLPDGTETTVSKFTVKTTDNWTWNVQAGYRLGNTRLRAGLFESSGGVGVDQSFLKNRLGLTFEAYEFDRDEKAPHLRLEARWFFHPNLYTYGGWDDPVWSERQSAFVGAGIRWSDEDLKYLLGTAAAAVP
ncbi:MAG TPA: MlaD family protein [Candidatus Polarisedimenticolaceae bacterium]